MNEKITNPVLGINSTSAYNPNKKNNDSSNFNQKQKEKNEIFQNILDSQLDKQALPNTTKTEFVSYKNIIYNSSSKYKIKYAIIPAYLTSTNQEKDDIIGYFISRCFVINKNENGYEIVCPYNSMSEYKIPINLPKFENGKCINSIITSKVYDDCTYCKVICDLKNANLDKGTRELLESFENSIMQKTRNLEENDNVKFSY